MEEVEEMEEEGGACSSPNRGTKAKYTELPSSSPAARNPSGRGEHQVASTEARGLAPVRARSKEAPKVEASSKGHLSPA